MVYCQRNKDAFRPPPTQISLVHPNFDMARCRSAASGESTGPVPCCSSSASSPDDQPPAKRSDVISVTPIEAGFCSSSHITVGVFTLEGGRQRAVMTSSTDGLEFSILESALLVSTADHPTTRCFEVRTGRNCETGTPYLSPWNDYLVLSIIIYYI